MSSKVQCWFLHWQTVWSVKTKGFLLLFNYNIILYVLHCLTDSNLCLPSRAKVKSVSDLLSTLAAERSGGPGSDKPHWPRLTDGINRLTDGKNRWQVSCEWGVKQAHKLGTWQRLKIQPCLSFRLHPITTVTETIYTVCILYILS